MKTMALLFLSKPLGARLSPPALSLSHSHTRLLFRLLFLVLFLVLSLPSLSHPFSFPSFFPTLALSFHSLSFIPSTICLRPLIRSGESVPPLPYTLLILRHPHVVPLDVSVVLTFLSLFHTPPPPPPQPLFLLLSLSYNNPLSHPPLFQSCLQPQQVSKQFSLSLTLPSSHSHPHTHAPPLSLQPSAFIHIIINRTSTALFPSIYTHPISLHSIRQRHPNHISHSNELKYTRRTGTLAEMKRQTV
ncbi:hypothetical protein BC939DRAFT_229555 [Gamsiella multidivaricata]|uniref:uncharacterized protein n=1 Tax=Gamsiella multidivaricata TaxID=101098 RepID=UPI002220F719|nr:uncharacterized protein BC939DRAFT_229555 [Gamsiella multidivaricata]KAI7820494.1 hypothetical protein BC939DRAFT_229555 [Gamsiella multidivaricata]